MASVCTVQPATATASTTKPSRFIRPLLLAAQYLTTTTAPAPIGATVTVAGFFFSHRKNTNPAAAAAAPAVTNSPSTAYASLCTPAAPACVHPVVLHIRANAARSGTVFAASPAPTPASTTPPPRSRAD